MESSTEYQSLSIRVDLLERQAERQFAVLSAQNAVILAETRKITVATLDILESWDGAKTVVSFAKTSGKITVAFAAFLTALAATWAIITGSFK